MHLDRYHSNAINKITCFRKPTHPHLPFRAKANSAFSRQTITQLTADSGCTEILLRQSSAHLLENRQPCTSLQVTVANNQIITSVEKGTITIPTKSGDIVLTAHVFNKSNSSNNLAGLSNLTNLQCAVTLTATSITISRGDEIIWSGIKECDDNLWNLDFVDLQIKSKNSQL
jgi:hypothetical protein